MHVYKRRERVDTEIELGYDEYTFEEIFCYKYSCVDKLDWL